MTRILALMLPVCLGIGVAVWHMPAWGQAQRQEATTGAEIGRIVIVNQITTKVDDYRTHKVGEIEVTVHYHSTANDAAGDPRDIITISVPDGYMAIPPDVLLPEGESVEVLIYEAVVG